MVTHDMRLVAEYADRWWFWRGAGWSSQGSPSEFFARPDEVEAAGLEMPSPGKVRPC